MRTTFAIVALTLCTAPACALETFKREFELGPGDKVVVEAHMGTIRVTGSDTAAVVVEGTRDENSGEFSIERDGKVLYIEDQRYGENAGGAESELTIRMPRDGALEASIIAGNIEVRDMSGVVEISAVSGNVDVQCDCGRIEAESVSGNVVIRNATSLARGDFSSVSGNVDIETALVDGANIDVESVSGKVRIAIHGDIDARVSVETGPGGQIENGFNDERPDRERYTGSESLDLQLGNGAGDIDVSTVSGTVILERK